jgi:hypothetical protein
MRTLRLRSFLPLLLGLLLPALPAQAQRGAYTAHQNLNEIATEAATIVRGTVLSARTEKHPQLQNLSMVVVQLRVSEVWKGSADTTFTFRQFVWDFRDKLDQAGYRKGQEVVLYLRAPSEYGLSSPVGLEQGRFQVNRDRWNQETALNGRGNAGLLQGVEKGMKARGRTPSAHLAKTLRERTAGGIAVADLREATKGGAQ